MIDRRTRQSMHRSKSMHLMMPIRTRLEQNSATTSGQTGRLARRSPIRRPASNGR